MSLDTMTANFSLDRVVKAPAGFDPDKLYSFQGHWMKVLPDDQKLAGVLPYLVQAGLLSEPVAPEQQAFVAQIVAALGDRLKVFSDILAARSFFCDDYPVDQKNFDKRVRKEGIPAQLSSFAERMSGLEPFTVSTLEQLLPAFCEEAGLNTGDLIHALRLATTGQPVGPGVYDCLVLLGKERSLARIAAAVKGSG